MRDKRLMPSPNFLYSLQNLGRSYTSYLRFHKMQREKAGDRQFTKHKYTCHEPLKNLAECPGVFFILNMINLPKITTTPPKKLLTNYFHNA